MNKVFKLTIILFTIIFVVFSAMFGVLAAKKTSQIAIGDDVDIKSLEQDVENLGIINMLLIGVDEGGMRSDTIMLVSIDSFSNRVNLLSIPRDTMVKVPGYTPQKINALVGIGHEKVEKGDIKEAEELLIETVKTITGLPIHYFMSVDFNGFKDIVEALDGIDFAVPYDMDYDDPAQNLHIHLKAGFQHLDGQAAHDFVRFRHNNDGSAPGEYVLGDEGREYWQQEFLKELIIQKNKSQYLTKIDSLFKIVKQKVRTNYTMKDLLQHIGLVQSVNINDIGSYQLPGESVYINSVWWYVYDDAETESLIADVFMPKSEEDWEKYKSDNGNDNRHSSAITGKQNNTSMQIENIKD